MERIVAFILLVLALPFGYPEKFLEWSRKVRQHMRDDFRARASQTEWEKYKDEFQDL